ncbi:MAG: tetratricopeptide repeat protein [Chloroflexi bacterium]|nr:tetratricopeptide repeat protein [Chloroflexota bacterium]
MAGAELLSLERACFEASGLEPSRVEAYLARLDEMCAISGVTGGDDYSRAKALFDRLWRVKPQRYRSGGNFRLHRVIDAQLVPGVGPAGNCLGLTILFNVLARRLGLKVEATYLEDEFGNRSHVISVVRAAGRTVEVEHMFPGGYDCFRDFGGLKARWGDGELVADVYLSEGNVLFDRGQVDAALECYRRSLALNPGYRKACINAAMALMVLGRHEEAREMTNDEARMTNQSPIPTSRDHEG